MADFFANWLVAPLAYLLAALIHCGLILGLVAVAALFFIWLERKVSGRIQDRLGPTRVGGKFGWLQTLADGIKLIAKEDLAPKAADQWLFRIAPYVSFAASYTAFLALPFSNGWVAFDVNVAVFFILAVLGLEVFGVILAGYASGSKWSLFGAMREAAQVVSYEVPLGICVVIPVLLCGTMNLTTIGNMQAGWFTNWLIFHDPFTFCVFWVYFACALASVNRAPFDLAEAESELVAGFLTEYSGLRWSYFFMAEYGSMLLVSGLAAILFFGGWNGPIPIFQGLAYEPGETAWRFGGFLANTAGCVNFIGKALLGVTIMMWVRWTLPRLRIDQVMTMCLKYCVPLAAICFIGVMTWQVLGLPSPNRWKPAAEPWLDEEVYQETVLLDELPAAGRLAESPLASSWSAPPGSPTDRRCTMILLAAVDWYAFFFMLFGALACVFAVAVLLTNNIVRMAFYLTLSLGATAGLFFLAGAEFVGSMQLMIYVGGTMVLLIFGVMLTAQARFITMRTLSGEWVLSIIVGSALLFLLLVAAFGVPQWRTQQSPADLTVADTQTATPVGAALSGIRVDKLNTDPDRQERSGTLSGYLLPFVIVSVHLLVVLIGAAYMARARVVTGSGAEDVSAPEHEDSSGDAPT